MSNSISTLLLRNLSDVFGENDPMRRRAAIDEIFHEDVREQTARHGPAIPPRFQECAAERKTRAEGGRIGQAIRIFSEAVQRFPKYRAPQNVAAVPCGYKARRKRGGK